MLGDSDLGGRRRPNIRRRRYTTRGPHVMTLQPGRYNIFKNTVLFYLTTLFNNAYIFTVFFYYARGLLHRQLYYFNYHTK